MAVSTTTPREQLSNKTIFYNSSQIKKRYLQQKRNWNSYKKGLCFQKFLKVWCTEMPYDVSLTSRAARLTDSNAPCIHCQDNSLSSKFTHNACWNRRFLVGNNPQNKLRLSLTSVFFQFILFIVTQRLKSTALQPEVGGLQKWTAKGPASESEF